MKELVTIQQKLKAPKGQYNTFGKYKYSRSRLAVVLMSPRLIFSSFSQTQSMFDAKKFQEDHPELYSQYLKTSTKADSIRVTIREEGK